MGGCALDLGAEELVELVLRGHRGGRSHGQVGEQRVEPPRHGGRFVMSDNRSEKEEAGLRDTFRKRVGT